MKVKFNTDRKTLTAAVCEITGAESRYLGVPSCAYEIGDLILDREGNLTCENQSRLELITERLADRGYEAEVDACEDLVIELPRSGFTDTQIDIIRQLIESKSTLIKKAFGAESLPVEVTDDKISFPWFQDCPEPEEISACAKFIGKLCGVAKQQKRVSAKDHEVENEKYAFRCFLLRLGFVGPEYKTERKILLKNLSGSSAFKGGTAK